MKKFAKVLAVEASAVAEVPTTKITYQAYHTTDEGRNVQTALAFVESAGALDLAGAMAFLKAGSDSDVEVVTDIVE